MSKAREIVLRLVSEGTITVEEAEELLDGINGGVEKPFDDILGNKDADPRAGVRAGHGRAREKREKAHERHAEVRERHKEAREKTRETREGRRGSRSSGFEFNFPWEQEDWQWPWEQEDWQWPWEQEGWQWGQASEEEEKPVATVEVPEGAQLSIRVSNGDTVIQGNGQATSLRLVAPDAPGKITAEDGVINISSEGEDVVIEVPENVASIEIMHSVGDVAITKVKADMVAKVSGGNMTVSEFAGKLQASVAGGDASLMGIDSASVEVRTEGGDTNLGLLSSLKEGSILLSGNDDISLRLPSDSQCEISASAGGDIEHSLPPEALEIMEENDNYLSAKLNGGGAEITLSASSGDVNISTVEAVKND